MGNRGEIIYVVRHLGAFSSSLLDKITFPMPNPLTTIKHFGIDMGNGTVIHFSGEKSIFEDYNYMTIRRTSMDFFLDGGTRQTCEFLNYRYTPEQVARRAISKLKTGFGEYDIRNNNCEHFAMWCATGQQTSRQVFFQNDDQDIVEKALDNVGEVGSKVAGAIDDAAEAVADKAKEIWRKIW